MAHTEVDFTYQEAVRTLGVTPEKLDRLIDEGKISIISTSAQTLVPRESILRYLATVTAVGREKKKAAAPAKEAPAAKAAPKAPAPEKPAPVEAAATGEAPAAAVQEAAAPATPAESEAVPEAAAETEAAAE